MARTAARGFWSQLRSRARTARRCLTKSALFAAVVAVTGLASGACWADAVTGEPKKSSYGPWMLGAFRVLAKMKGLRGGALDVFGRTAERKAERELITDYEVLLNELTAKLDAHNYAVAVELASIPEHIRGYGHVKERHLKAAKTKESELLAAFRAAPSRSAAPVERVAA